MKVEKSGSTEIFTQEIGQKIKDMDKANFSGLMATSIKALGSIIKSKAMENTSNLMVIIIKGSG